ncbi:MAG TPA: MASE1 domain-containing protein [Candidatus Dormibacteraeota bacterium]
MSALTSRLSPHLDRRSLVRLAIEILLVALVYWGGAWLGLRLAFSNRNVTAVWPPTGIAVAALFLLGPRVWPGVFLGALLGNLTNAAPLETSAGIAVGNTLAPVLATYLLRSVGFRATLDRVVDVAGIVAAGLFGMLVSASLGSTVLLLTGQLSGSFSNAWTVWWIGDAMGVIVLAPVIFTLVTTRDRWRMPPLQAVEAVAFLILMPAAAFAFVAANDPLWYLVIPLALWGALRFRQPVAAVTVFLISTVSVVAVYNGLGPVTNLPLTTRLATLQLFNASLALTVMLLVALADERSEAWDALQASARDLEDRVRERTDEMLAAQRSAAEATEREATNLRAAVDRISRLERMKSDFLQLASHELRGPVGIIRGYLEMLADGTFGETPASIQPAMSVLDDKAEQMGRLVAQMLETARLETDHPVTERRPVDLAELLRGAVDSAATVVSSKHRFVVENADAAATVFADPDQVNTILTNLLDNAVRYSPDGCEIKTRLETRNGTVAVLVSDAGIGIAPEDVGRLFKSFSRVVTAENAHITGTGLGLYISRKLAVVNGGDLAVSSSPGTGSTFTLTLPASRDGVSPDR